MLQKEAIWQELERFNVVHDENFTIDSLGTDFDSLLELARKGTNAEQPYVLASVLMRNIAFVFTAQLYVLSKYRLKWTGPISEIGLADRTLNDRWFPQWVFSEGCWISLEKEMDVIATIKQIICQDCNTIVQELARKTKSSPLVLWENVWGYVLWMYVQLLRETGDVSPHARYDLEQLLDSKTWKSVKQYSPFQKFLNGKSPEEAMAHYARVTCCLYYQVPGNEKCSYCPKTRNCITTN